MKRILTTLFCLCISTPTWASSPALDNLLTELEAQYGKTYTSGAKERDKADLTKLPYFIMHISEEDTPEKLKLDAYLTGLHNGIYESVNMQRKMNAPTWFCMQDTMIMNPKRHPNFLKELIWDVLEEVANEDPTRFSRVNYANAFGLSLDSVIRYGLQTRYPCFKPIPKQLQLNGWKY